MVLLNRSVLRLTYKSNNNIRSIITRRSVSTPSTWTEEAVITTPPPNVDQEDDTTFFKRLGKTVDPYWLQNAADLFNNQRLDFHRLLHPSPTFLENLRRRGADNVDFSRITRLYNELEQLKRKKFDKSAESTTKEELALMQELVEAALWVPNDTHPAALALQGDEPKTIYVHGEKKEGTKVVEFQKVKLVRTLGPIHFNCVDN
jgi:hypothetical protein